LWPVCNSDTRHFIGCGTQFCNPALSSRFDYLALLAAIASAIEAGMHLYASGTAPILVVAAGLTSLGAAIARVVAQPALTAE
jgi:hypothetical protein